ncbi:excinuclease ABC subunit A, partial [Patescibacteria group bacterium]|nr:excinuclease ABC subunit A [Patescibacteria group bacterium]
MKKDVIKIKGAKVHNLKNVSVDIPRNKLVVITGISGSGKSSLAFDTLYAEGQRRYVESLSTYARQFLGVMDKPNVEKIEGISPAISIDQRKAGHNPRSTVGTITEIYDYFRLLFSKVGKPHCPECGKPISQQTVDQIVKQVLKLLKKSEITILAPTSCSLEQIKRKGFVRVRADGNIYFVDKAPKKNHNIEIVVDELIIDKNIDRLRLKDSLEIALKIGKGSVIVNDLVFRANFTCEKCNIFIPELEPRFFSFNNPYGACPKCKGLGEKLEIDPELIIPNPNLTIAEGAIMSYRSWDQLSIPLDKPVKELPKKFIDIIIAQVERKYHETNSDWTRQEIEQYMVKRQCPECLGKRLKPEVLAVRVEDKSINEIVEMSIGETKLFFEKEFSKIAQPIVKEILIRLQFLIDVGLDYLCLDRKAITLAGGEGQRIRLATQIGSKLTGVLYILDEPSIGLHSRDQARLIKTLKKLRDLGNTVIIVEHDNKIIRAADWV